MSARICSVCKATLLPPITAKPRTPNTTRLLLSTSILSIRKRPFGIPLSNKRLIATPSHFNLPKLVNPRQHYVYGKDLRVDGSAKSVSNLVHINTRDILSIMAVQELRQEIRRYKDGDDEFRICHRGPVPRRISWVMEAILACETASVTTAKSIQIARGEKKTRGLHKIKEGS